MLTTYQLKWNSTSLNVLEGRELKENEFSFVLKDSEGKTLETVSNDAAGNVKFSKLEFKKGQEGVHNYTVEEVKGSDATVTIRHNESECNSYSETRWNS